MAASIVNIPDPFDPSTTTLRKFIELYEAAGKKQGKFKDSYNRKTGKTTVGRWPNASLLLNAEGIKEYLDRPVLDILRRETLQDTTVGYNKAISTPTRGESEVASSRIGNIRSAMDAIHSNVIRQVERIDPNLKVDLVNPRDHIVVPKTGTEGRSRAAEIKIDPYKLGEYFIALEDYAQANPADAPAIRAFIFGLNTGLRPEESSSITSDNIKPPVEGTGRTAPSLYVPVTKTSTEVNAPMSSMALAVLDRQTDFNAKLNNRKFETPYVFMQEVEKKRGNKTVKVVEPVTSSDITKVIGKIKVPGVFYEVLEDGSQVPMDKLTGSYDLRRINATIYDILPDVDRESAALVKGRDIKGGGREGGYVATAAGIFDPKLDDAVLRLGDFLTAQYSRALEKAGRIPTGTLVSSTTIPTDIEVDTESQKRVYPTGAPRALNIKMSPTPSKVPEVTVQKAEGTSTIAGGPQEVVEKDSEKLSSIDEKSQAGLRSLLSKGRRLPGVGVLAAMSGLSYTVGSEKARAEGAGELGQVAAGVATTVYDIAAPVASLAVEPLSPLAGPEQSEIDLSKGIPETEFTRGQEIQMMDKRKAAIDEQMRRITEYDKYVEAQKGQEESLSEEIQADIEVTYPNGE